MLVAQTTAGVSRVIDAGYEILDLGGASLSDLIISGSMERLHGAKVIDALDKERTQLLTPINAPGKMIVIGLNYRDHAAEMNLEPPSRPRVHLTAASAVIGPDEAIPLPTIAASAVDFEGEMAVVIGKPASDVPVREAWSHVAGITAANDVSARDIQDGSNSWVAGPNVGLAKGFDGFKPLGPALLTTDDFRGDRPLGLRTLVDGELRQDSSTAEMLFSVADLVSHVSRYTTLHRGDVVLTGTPAGVGAFDGRFLTAGQVVQVELEGVGVLRNSVTTQAGVHPHRQ